MWIKSILILVFFVFISGCGYHLRESIDLPEALRNIHLEGGSGQLQRIIKRTLRSSNSRLVDDPKDAGLIVKIVKEKFRRRVLSLGANGRANEYELEYSLDFVLLDFEGKSLSEKQQIEISRDYFNDQEDILGKNDEEELIRNEMYRQVVQSILNRSRIVLEQSN
jgi:LPS-assembly lipoprotein